MADARRARTERRATRVAQTTLVGPTGARWSPSPMVNAATGPDVQEYQGSSQPATEHPDGRTATPSLVWASESATDRRCRMASARLPWTPSFSTTIPPLTAKITGSTASRSSSPLSVIPRHSPARFDPNRP
ncbi:hypothetical protein D1007_51822 [Hordeum vulgare]|nr:hypothetical protein D1007_51822 [Hordeum vulgare]